MKYEWDERKNKANIRKHGIDFADAEEMFDGPMLVRADAREDYGEDRWLGIGMIAGRILAVAFTIRGADTIRIISLRRANQYERNLYEEAIQDELGAH